LWESRNRSGAGHVRFPITAVVASNPKFVKIIVDTTVFAQGFNTRSANVGLLKRFIESMGAELCVPSIVYEETINLVRKSIEDVNTKLDAVHRLTGGGDPYTKLNTKTALADFTKSLITC